MPQIIQIEDPNDPLIDAYRHIRERDLVGRQGLFIAEGEVVVRQLLGSSRYRPLSLLIAEKRLAGLARMLSALTGDVPVFSAGQGALDTIAGFSLHRGILALGARAPDLSPEALLHPLGLRSVVVVLVGIANHDNMGGIFRNAAAFGAGGILLDTTCCDPMYRKAIRVSVGAVLAVPFARLQADEDPISAVLRHGFEPIALSPRGSSSLSRSERPDRVALFLGTEGGGLPQAVLSRCRSVRIDMAGHMDSLNVATASGIALHHFAGGEMQS